MKKPKINIRITLPVNNLEINSSTRQGFWTLVSKSFHTETNNPEYLEYEFKKNFPKKLKDSLKEKYQKEIRNIEQTYRIDYERFYFDKMFFRYFEKLEKARIDDFMSGISKLQELKNEYFKSNIEYQELERKYLLATQIDFGVQDISYSSLGFNLDFEPIEKVAQIFDNNFDYFKIFLNQYISECFLESIPVNNNNTPVSVSFDYSEELEKEFEGKNKDKITMAKEPKEKKNSDKEEKAKWLWALTNGSLVIPVILALIVLFVTFNKIESIFKIRQDNYQNIQIENEKVLKSYQELIDIQKKTYNDLIEELKNDTIK